MKKALPWILIAGAAVVALFAAGWPAVQFAKLDDGEFVSRLGPLVVFTLLIERTLEVSLTIPRAEEPYKGEADVQRLITSGKRSTDTDLK